MARLTTADMDYEARLCGTIFVKLNASLVLASVRGAYKATAVTLFIVIHVSGSFQIQAYFHSFVTPWFPDSQLLVHEMFTLTPASVLNLHPLSPRL